MQPTEYCLRNREPILNVVRNVFPSEGTILEIASGNGGHVTFLASQLSGLAWQPSEAQEESLPLIQQFVEQENLTERIKPPLFIVSCACCFLRFEIGQKTRGGLNVLVLWLLVTDDGWQDVTTDFASRLTEQYDGALAVNLLHISPWEATQGFFRGLSAVLKPNAPVCVYGPFGFNGTISPQSNVDFDAFLKTKNPSYGIRDIADVQREAQAHGFELTEQHAVPANNFVMVFRKQQ